MILRLLSSLAVVALLAGPALAQSAGYVRVLDDSDSAALTAVAKTATFNSETLNLQGYATFCLVLDIGTVSGSSPTMDPKVQLTLDGGTTWLDTYPVTLNSETQAAMTQLTGTGETTECWRNVFPVVAGFSTAASSVTPRVRFVFTFGGSSPSFTFTNAYIVTSESP